MTVEEALRTVDHSTRTGDIYRAARALAAEVRRLRAIESTPPRREVVLSVEEAEAAASCAEGVGRGRLAEMLRQRIAAAKEAGS